MHGHLDCLLFNRPRKRPVKIFAELSVIIANEFRLFEFVGDLFP
jgi:hypothetical protein